MPSTHTVPSLPVTNAYRLSRTGIRIPRPASGPVDAAPRPGLRLHRSGGESSSSCSGLCIPRQCRRPQGLCCGARSLRAASHPAGRGEAKSTPASSLSPQIISRSVNPLMRLVLRVQGAGRPRISLTDRLAGIPLGDYAERIRFRNSEVDSACYTYESITEDIIKYAGSAHDPW